MLTLILTAPWLILSLVWLAVRWWRRRKTERRVFTWGFVAAFVASFFVWWILIVPEGLGYLGSTVVGTRHFERDYPGPTLDPTGRIVQLIETEHSFAEPVFFESSDGLKIRGYHLPADFDRDQPTWVLAHGLFRNALELEPVAEMLHQLEVPVMLVELRNHGGSDRAAPSFGLRESRDILAAVDWLRAGGHATEFVLFGVSLGSIAASIAAPQVEGLRGIVLDAPIQDLERAAQSSLRRSRRRLPPLPWFVLERSLDSLQRWSDFRFEDVRPGEAVRSLDPSVAVLLIAAGRDRRATPESVQELYEGLPTQPDRKWLWLAADSDHGDVWGDDPEGYALRLGAMVLVTRSWR